MSRGIRVPERALTRRAAVVGAGGALGALVLGRGRATAHAQAPAQAHAAQAGSPAAVLGGVVGGAWDVVDLSVTTAEDFPVSWPNQPQFEVDPLTWFRSRRGPTPPGETGSVRTDIAAVTAYQITEHTGTQIDFPPHFIPPPGVNIPGARGGPMGRMTGDKFAMTAFMGPAVVIDLRAVLAAHKAKGKSAIVQRAWIERWEARYGRIQPGEVPLLYSGYTDRYFKRFPEGKRMQDRMLWKVLVDKSEPGWCALAPEAVELMWDRGVKHLATDGPSFGSAEKGQEAHVAGLRHGMSWTECTIGLGRLPVRGAFFASAPYKVREQQAAIGRAFAFNAKGAAAVRDTPPLEL
jgi:kynurenine formamidase